MKTVSSKWLIRTHPRIVSTFPRILPRCQVLHLRDDASSSSSHVFLGSVCPSKSSLHSFHCPPSEYYLYGEYHLFLWSRSGVGVVGQIRPNQTVTDPQLGAFLEHYRGPAHDSRRMIRRVRSTVLQTLAMKGIDVVGYWFLYEVHTVVDRVGICWTP